MNAHPALRLHVPEPSGRPGCATDFSYLQISGAGTVRKPPVATTHFETADLAYALIGVLDRDGRAVGPWVPDIAITQLRKGRGAGGHRNADVAVSVFGQRPHADDEG